MTAKPEADATNGDPAAGQAAASKPKHRARPGPQGAQAGPAGATKPAAPRRPSPARSARRRSRELALQGLYQWLLSHDEGGVVAAHIAEQDGFAKCDREHFDALLFGCIEGAAELDAILARHVDRKTSLLSPVEHAVLMIGCWELLRCVEIPYRVAINEAVELAKAFGGTDGHKYVNGVLDRCAAELRPHEARPERR